MEKLDLNRNDSLNNNDYFEWDPLSNGVIHGSIVEREVFARSHSTKIAVYEYKTGIIVFEKFEDGDFDYKQITIINNAGKRVCRFCNFAYDEKNDKRTKTWDNLLIGAKMVDGEYYIAVKDKDYNYSEMFYDDILNKVIKEEKSDKLNNNYEII